MALRLRHPNIVTVMGTSVDPPTRELLLVTAVLERGTLYDLLHNDTVSLPIVSHWSSHLPTYSLKTCSFACLHSLTHLLARSSIQNKTNCPPTCPFNHLSIYTCARHVAPQRLSLASLLASLWSGQVLVRCCTQSASAAVHALRARALPEPSLFCSRCPVQA